MARKLRVEYPGAIYHVNGEEWQESQAEKAERVVMEEMRRRR